MKKTYIAMPNTDYGPAGPLVLGSLITHPLEPESFVEGYRILPFPTSALNLASRDRLNIQYHKQQSGKYGIFTKFCQILGIGVELSVDQKRNSNINVKIRRLETQFFTPTRDYLGQVLQTPAVKTFISEERFKANVYIVTGLRIAYGGSAHEQNERDYGFHVVASVDITEATGVPLQAGPDISQSWKKKEDISYEKSSDYIYAYRVKEVHYSKMKKRVIAKDVRGDLYTLDSKKSAREDQNDAKLDEDFMLELTDRGAEWLSAKAMRVQALEVVGEDGEECELVWPRQV